MLCTGTAQNPIEISNTVNRAGAGESALQYRLLMAYIFLKPFKVWVWFERYHFINFRSERQSTSLFGILTLIAMYRRSDYEEE